MKKYLGLVCFLLVSFVANADQNFDAGNAIVSLFNDQNVFVSQGAVVSGAGGTIQVDYPSVILHNNGEINGVIDAGDNILYIYNTGKIKDGVIVSGIGAATQMITSDAEFTQVSLSGANSRIKIEGVPSIDFDKIKSNNANYFDIKSTSVTYIVINDFQDWQNWEKTVSLEGEIVLLINDKNTVIADVPVNHVTEGDKVQVHINGLDNLYQTKLEEVGTDFVLRIFRETNYNKVSDDSSETVLETIRQNHPNDKLLKMLDNADDSAEIKRIKNTSYRFNHGILLKPIKVINNFMMTDMIKDKTDAGAGFVPWYIISDKTSDFGGRLYIGHAFDNVYFNAGFNMNYFSYKDKVNEFSSLAYGLDLKAKEQFDNLWFSQVMGINLGKVKANYIYVDDKVKNNPFEFSGYGEAVVGYDINILSDFVVAPFAGLAYQRYKIVDVTDSDFYGRAGADAKYSFVTDGIKYEYALSASAASNGNLYSNLKAGFWSVTDLAGAHLEAGLFKNDLGCHYKFSLTAKMSF